MPYRNSPLNPKARKGGKPIVTTGVHGMTSKRNKGEGGKK